MSFGQYFVYRIIGLIFQVLGAIALVFVMLEIIPYDPTIFFLFTFRGSEQERAQELAQLRASLGIDQPIHIQYIRFIKELIINQSLGTSWITGESVIQLIMEKIPNTIVTFGIAFLVYTPLAFLLGIVSSQRKGKLFDTIARILTTATYSIPSYILGLWFVIYTTKFDLGYWPRPVPSTFFGLLKFSLFPIIVVVLVYTGFQFRLVRRHMLDILRQNYIRTARAKGLAERTVIYKHALRNALPYFITTVAVTFPMTFSGVAALEVVFNIPGVGDMMIDAALQFDWPVLLGITVVFTIINAFLLGLTDILVTYFSPKMKVNKGLMF